MLNIFKVLQKKKKTKLKFFENLGIYKHHSINWFNTNPKITRDQMQNILKTGNNYDKLHKKKLKKNKS